MSDMHDAHDAAMSAMNEVARLEAENRDLRAKLEAAERERDEARQIISLSKGLRNDSNPIYAEVKQLREQRDALAAALEQSLQSLNRIKNAEYKVWSSWATDPGDDSVEGYVFRLKRYAREGLNSLTDPAAILAERDRAKDEQMVTLLSRLAALREDIEEITGYGWSSDRALISRLRELQIEIESQGEAYLEEHDREVRRKALEEAVENIQRMADMCDSVSYRFGVETIAVPEPRRMAEEQK